MVHSRHNQCFDAKVYKKQKEASNMIFMIDNHLIHFSPLPEAVPRLQPRPSISGKFLYHCEANSLASFAFPKKNRNEPQNGLKEIMT